MLSRWISIEVNTIITNRINKNTIKLLTNLFILILNQHVSTHTQQSGQYISSNFCFGLLGSRKDLGTYRLTFSLRRRLNGSSPISKNLLLASSGLVSNFI